MNLKNAFTNLRKTKPVNIGDLNRIALARPSVAPTTRISNRLNSGEDNSDIIITDEFKYVVDRINNPRSPILFVSGVAGTGKSTLIRYLRSTLQYNMAVIAPTGVAAINVEGATIHSMFHFPPRMLMPEDFHHLSDRKLFNKLEVLIIDEISMVRADIIDAIDLSLRLHRKNNKPFGGVFVLFIGDLYQLPPVVTKDELIVLEDRGYASPFFFSALLLSKCSLDYIELTKIFRQSECNFINILNSIRKSEYLDNTLTQLNKRIMENYPENTITLTCTNKNADYLNNYYLEMLPNQIKTYNGDISGHFPRDYKSLPSPYNLSLKVGAKVMFTKNDSKKRWVNGSIGIVRRCKEDSIFVEMLSDNIGMIHEVEKVTWEYYRYVFNDKIQRIVAEVAGRYTQFPMMLSWAITIHKSQGKTLENIFLDTGSGAFASGQAYVALSRCRKLSNIYLRKEIRHEEILVDKRIIRFYEALSRLSSNPNDAIQPSLQQGLDTHKLADNKKHLLMHRIEDKLNRHRFGSTNVYWKCDVLNIQRFKSNKLFTKSKFEEFLDKFTDQVFFTDHSVDNIEIVLAHDGGSIESFAIGYLSNKENPRHSKIILTHRYKPKIRITSNQTLNDIFLSIKDDLMLADDILNSYQTPDEH